MELTTRLQRLLKQSDKLKQRMVKSLLKTMRKIEQERKERVADLDEAARVIARELADLGHKFVGNGKTSRTPKRVKTAKARTRKKRIRRTPEQLKAEAAKALTMIRKAGKDGIGGAELRKSIPGVGQNVKDFVERNTGEKIRTTGAKASMKYHA